MTIWLDADACPKLVKELCFKLAIRKKVQLILVANSYINYPSSNFIRAIQVHGGINSADNYIVMHVMKGDLVVTSDIELAHHILAKGGEAVSRGYGSNGTVNRLKGPILRCFYNQQKSFEQFHAVL